MVEFERGTLYDGCVSSPSFMMKGADMSHNRDKEKKEGKKKAQHDLKEKRKLKKEKHQKKSVITLPSQL